LHLDAESLRLVATSTRNLCWRRRRLSDTDKAALKKLNEEEANLSTAYISKLLAATKDAAFVTKDKHALAGLSAAQVAAAAQAQRIAKWMVGAFSAKHHAAAKPAIAQQSRHAAGALRGLVESRGARRHERHARHYRPFGATARAEGQIAGLPQPRGLEAGRPDGRTPEAALKFMDALVPAATARLRARQRIFRRSSMRSMADSRSSRRTGLLFRAGAQGEI